MIKEVTAQAPGRINIIGEHTDYNLGFVLPAAINKFTTVTLRPSEDPNLCTITALDLGETASFDLRDPKPMEPGWVNYIMGVAAELQKSGAQFPGFIASFSGTIPIGGGMSSSAALECSVAVGLNTLFDLQLPIDTMMYAAQMAEHNFVGTKCGIMDMFASMHGKTKQAMLLDCRSMEYKYFPIDLGDFQLLLLNTNVSHSLAGSAYNERRAACETGAAIIQQKFPEVTSLRDVTLPMLEACKDVLDPLVAQRCRYVVAENDRVLAATRSLSTGDHVQLGKLLYETHAGLQHEYEVSCPELDFLVAFTQQRPQVLGARMMGGGFGGCTLNIVHKAAVTELIEDASAAYREAFGRDLTPYEVDIAEGAKVLSVS